MCEPRVKIERVLLEEGANICVVTLNRPDKKNALDMDMFYAIRDAARDLASDRSLRAVILRGAGSSFCAGLDVKSVLQNPSNATKLIDRPAGQLTNLAQDVAWSWRTLPVPVIACMHGYCLGGGFQIALGADFRISTPDCKFAIMEAKWGLIPDMSGSVLLRELVSIDIAKELTMTARVFDGTQALKYGLVTRLSQDPFSEAKALALEVSTRSPDCVSAAKLLFNSTWDATEKEALEIETKLQRELLIPPLQNTVTAGARGLGFPINIPFKNRQEFWRGT